MINEERLRHCATNQLGLLLGLLEVDDGGGGADAAATAETLRPEMLAVTRLAIQLDAVRSHVLQLQHFIAHICRKERE